MQHPLNVLTETIIGVALDIHREIGPGMLESADEACLTFELLRLNLDVERQKALPLTESAVIVEVKAIES